jgi:flagellar biosynthesis anti-sigma factor FlgM
MRINGSGNPPIETNRQRSPKGTPAEGHDHSSPAAVVSIGQAAKAASTSAVDSSVRSRLEQVRAALERGEYSVDLDRLASRIIDDEVARGAV